MEVILEQSKASSKSNYSHMSNQEIEVLSKQTAIEYVLQEASKEDIILGENIKTFLINYKKHKNQFIHQDVVNDFCQFKEVKTLYRRISNVFQERKYFFVIDKTQNFGTWDDSSRVHFATQEQLSNIPNYQKRHGQNTGTSKHYYFHIDLMLNLILNCDKPQAQMTSLVITRLLRYYDDYSDQQHITSQLLAQRNIKALQYDNGKKQECIDELTSQLEEIRKQVQKEKEHHHELLEKNKEQAAENDQLQQQLESVREKIEEEKKNLENYKSQHYSLKKEKTKRINYLRGQKLRAFKKIKPSDFYKKQVQYLKYFKLDNGEEVLKYGYTCDFEKRCKQHKIELESYSGKKVMEEKVLLLFATYNSDKMISKYLSDMEVTAKYGNEYIEYSEVNFVLILSFMEAFRFQQDKSEELAEKLEKSIEAELGKQRDSHEHQLQKKDEQISEYIKQLQKKDEHFDMVVTALCQESEKNKVLLENVQMREKIDTVRALIAQIPNFRPTHRIIDELAKLL